MLKRLQRLCRLITKTCKDGLLWPRSGPYLWRADFIAYTETEGGCIKQLPTARSAVVHMMVDDEWVVVHSLYTKDGHRWDEVNGWTGKEKAK